MIGRLQRSFVWIVSIGLPGTAHAAEGHGGTWLGLPVWVWLWLNLIIFWGVLLRLIGPPLKKYFQERGAEIRSGISRAQEQRREAEEMRAALAEKIEEIGRQIDEVKERAAEEAEREREEILAQAKAEQAQLLERTREELRRGVEQARTELTQHTAELAAELAEKKLASRLDEQDRQRLFDESLVKLERVSR